MYILNTEHDTMKFAESIADKSAIGDCYALHGDLGVGKSTFVRYVIKCYDHSIKDIPSPTFSIIQYYDSCRVLHADCYRLESAEDVIDTGLLEDIPYFVSFIEWPEVIQEYLPSSTQHIYFSYSNNGRIAKIT